jgi:hypothetical protein
VFCGGISEESFEGDKVRRVRRLPVAISTLLRLPLLGAESFRFSVIFWGSNA